ncbi:MAG TPA: ABC transporter permease [Puia sp.]|jgi:putative ABC transport system permease protein|nr:ABC transporter permease [Puia sp.]
MLKNYLKTAWRNMQRNKINSILNISGLAIAMACMIIIVMYIKDELSYDRFFTGADHLFQVNMMIADNGVEGTTGGNTAPAVGPTLKSMYPEVESFVRVYRPGDVVVRYEGSARSENFYSEKNILAVDSNFLQTFDYKLLEGDAASCLQKTNSVVITEATAKKYFSGANPIGKVLLFDADKKPFTVTAVVKNIPSNTSFQFDMLAPITAYGEVKKRSWNWFWLQVNTWVRLKKNVPVDAGSVAKLEAKFPEMVRTRTFNKDYGQSYDEFIKKGGKLSFNLLPFTSVHLQAIPMQVPARLTTLSDLKYVYIFSIIALFIFILACVNFMNLSTAQSATRAKEVGIRKVMGSLNTQLVKQFLTEAMLYSFIAIMVGLVLVFLLLNPFNAIAGKSLGFGSIFKGDIWLFVLGLWLLTGLLAGIYPAFYLTSFNPTEVLKGVKLFKVNIGSLIIRNGLVVFQFTITVVLIICTIIVFQQLKYEQSKDLGLNKENVVVIENTKRLGNNEESFRLALTGTPGVIDASVSSSIPTKGNFGDGYVPEPAATDKPLLSDIGLSSFMVDNDFVPTLKLQILQGRNFSAAFNDSASVIINETAAKKIGWKEPVGKYLGYPGNDQRFRVIAVVRDFNIASLHELVEPFALFHTSSKTYNLHTSFISVRLQPGNFNQRIAQIEAAWKSFAPATPFDFSFLDNDFDGLYHSEQRMGTVFGIFTFLSIFVACLGLFGLSLFTAERRRKEIGVRKVLGASVGSVVGLLSKEFLGLVAIATVIAFPLAWFAMNKWLEDFAYRIGISWWIFLISAATAIAIALATVSFQAIKAAVANPVKSLRTE